MSLNLPVQSLSFEDIRSNFIEFLKGNPDYKDWNFDASGISTQMNILAYNTHYLGYYVKMLLDEAFTDTAHTRKALLSHAKRTGYIPKGRRSARAEVELKVSMDQADVPLNDMVVIPRGTSFTSTNAIQDTRTFQIPDDVIATDKTVNGSTVTYSTGKIIVYEGRAASWRFVADTSVHNQKFVIKDMNLDVSTLRVRLYANASATEFVDYKLAQYTDDIDSESHVFYVTTNEDGYFQIFFGNGVFGVQPSNGNVIQATYVSNNGVSGNGAKTFQFNAPDPDMTVDYLVGNFSAFEVITHSPSSGGMEWETNDSLKFSIPNHYRRQNRLLTESDFRGVLMEEFRNIDTMNVWGGEKHLIRDYGKVYCSIKPRNALALTNAAKAEIKQSIIDRYGIVGGDIVFVDPDYISAAVTLRVKVDLKRTNKNYGDIEGDILRRLADYNTSTLSQFKVDLSDVEMLNACKGGDSFITSIYSTKVLSKTSLVMYRSTGMNKVLFANEIARGSVKSSVLTYGGVKYRYIDEGGKLYLVNEAGAKGFTESFGTVDYATGTIAYTFPEFATVDGYPNTTGVMTFDMVPTYPDVVTSLNNIVRITSSSVVFR